MKEKAIVIELFCLIIWISTVAQTKHSTTTMYPSYDGLVMAGYQGWFHAPKNGVMFPDAKHIGIDLWPDVSEYQKTYPTGLKLADGSTARFFSSDDSSTIDLHFKWMKEYGIDGVFMQRFFNAAQPEARHSAATNVIKNAFAAASKYDRAIAIMYDLSGLKASGEDCSSLIEDWKFLVDSLHVTNQKGTHTYLFYNGKPLVVIWGLGFPDRPYNIRNIGIQHFINFLKYDPVYGGCSIMLGVPTFWRNLDNDCTHDPFLHQLIKQTDIIMPWMVQRFSPLLQNDMDRYRDDILEDMQWCKDHGIGYLPCVYPGFSWHNLSRYEFPDDVKPAGSIPREGGKFYWQQISTALRCGVRMLYVAMFDEVNEGTAIFKCTNNPPVSKDAEFIGMDGKPSDYYLWLTGEAAKMLHGEEPLSMTLPER
jgi:hypothetical protein